MKVFSQAARLSAEADKLLSDWRISVASHEATPDYQRFLSWREGYQQRLTELDADDANRAKFKAWALEKGKEAMSAAQKAVEASMARAAKRAGHVQHREDFLSKLINLFK